MFVVHELMNRYLMCCVAVGVLVSEKNKRKGGRARYFRCVVDAYLGGRVFDVHQVGMYPAGRRVRAENTLTLYWRPTHDVVEPRSCLFPACVVVCMMTLVLEGNAYHRRGEEWV